MSTSHAGANWPSTVALVPQPTSREPGAMPRECDDQTVGQGFADGAEWAIEEAYRRWSGLVFTVAMRAVGNRADAEDIVQVVFVSAWRGRANYHPDRAALPAWLMGVTKNKVADYWAGRAREQRRAEAVADASEAVPVTEKEVERITDRVLLADELAQLDEPQRKIMELAFYHELDAQSDRQCLVASDGNCEESHQKKSGTHACTFGGGRCRTLTTT